VYAKLRYHFPLNSEIKLDILVKLYLMLFNDKHVLARFL